MVRKNIIKEYFNKMIIKKVPTASSMADILGEDELGSTSKSSLLTFVTPFIYGRLFDNDPNKVLSKRSINFRQRIICNPLRKAGHLLLTNKELIVDKKVKAPENAPVIFASNHGFVEDAITISLVTNRNAYYLSGNMSMSLNSIFGLILYTNGSIFLNRRDKSSRCAVVDKAVRALELGTSIYYYPEGVWNKTANQLTLKFWSGIINVAYKSKAPIVPVIQLPVGDKIYASQLEPFDISQYGKDNLNDALEDLQTIFNTELWRLMEKYAKFSYAELLGNHINMAEMYEEHLEKVIEASGTYYDYPVETSSDFRPKNIIRPEEVWAPIAQLEITAQNKEHVLYARELVERCKREDYQRRF